jgi:hypothetical protein
VPEPKRRCYADTLGDCEGGISKEHYFSNAVLGAFPEDIFNVSGFHWQQSGGQNTLPFRAFRAKILCKKHNDALSHLDAEAGKFFRTIYNCTCGGIQGMVPVDNLCFEFNGRLHEMWLLKVICGAIASGNYGMKSRIVPRILVEILFERHPWPSEFGFYLPAETHYTVPEHGDVRFQFIRDAGNIIKGITCHFMCYNATLALGSYSGVPGIQRRSSTMGFFFKREEREMCVKLQW